MTYEIASTERGSLLQRIASFFKEMKSKDDLKEQIKRERSELAMLDDKMLQDIGITRHQALRESRRNDDDISIQRLRFWICCQ